MLAVRGGVAFRPFVSRIASFSTVRVRQHVNPLSRKFLEPIAVPEWSGIFPSGVNRVHLDIGCARAQYLMQLASLHPSKAFLGVEIREPLVHEALERIQQQELGNIHIVHANMNVHIHALLSSLAPQYEIESVSIFHPDPWMKKRHIKRRLVNETFVQDLAKLVPHNTPIYLQTDVLELFEYMVEIFSACPLYMEAQDIPNDLNAMGLATDRERHVVSEGGPIYRTAFRTLRN